MKKFATTLFIPFLSAFLGACAHSGDRAPVHPAREAVLFEGIEFKVNSKEFRYSGLSAAGKTVTPRDVFIIIEVSLKNSYSSPVPAQFHPMFTLVDSGGREHFPQKETASNGKGPVELSPKTAYTRRLVFDVPEDDYRLRVFIPIIVKPGPSGSIQGRYFYYDLGSGR